MHSQNVLLHHHLAGRGNDYNVDKSIDVAHETAALKSWLVWETSGSLPFNHHYMTMGGGGGATIVLRVSFVLKRQYVISIKSCLLCEYWLITVKVICINFLYFFEVQKKYL